MVDADGRVQRRKLADGALAVAMPGRVALSRARVDRRDLGRHRDAQDREVRTVCEIEVVEMKSVECRLIESDSRGDLPTRGEEKPVEGLHAAENSRLQAENRDFPRGTRGLRIRHAPVDMRMTRPRDGWTAYEAASR